MSITLSITLEINENEDRKTIGNAIMQAGALACNYIMNNEPIDVDEIVVLVIDCGEAYLFRTE